MGKVLDLGLAKGIVPQVRELGQGCLRAPHSPGPRSPKASKGEEGPVLAYPSLRLQSPHLPGGGGPPMPLGRLTEGSKSTLVMLPPAPSRVWLASRRPEMTAGRDRCSEVTNLMKMRNWEWENQSFPS